MEEKLFCNECGEELSIDSKFCNKCGYKIVSENEIDNQEIEEASKDIKNTEIKQVKIDSDYVAYEGKPIDEITFSNIDDISTSSEAISENAAIIENSNFKNSVVSFFANIAAILFASIIGGLVLGVIIFIFARRDFGLGFAISFWGTLITLTIGAIGGTLSERKRIKIAKMTPSEKKEYEEKQARKEERAQMYAEIARANEAAKKANPKQQHKANKKAGIVSCPKCGSQSITTTNKKISVTKGVVGGAVGSMINPVGTVVGAAVGATHSKKINNVCMNCGHRWKP